MKHSGSKYTCSKAGGRGGEGGGEGGGGHGDAEYFYKQEEGKKAGEQRGFVQTWGRPRLAHPGVGVPSSSVEAVLVPLVRVLWEGMTSERVTLVLLVLWLLE